MSFDCPRHGKILYGTGCTDRDCECKPPKLYFGASHKELIPNIRVEDKPLSDGIRACSVMDQDVTHVGRRIVVFKKNSTGYYIYLAAEGYQTTLREFTVDHLPLGQCKNEELEAMIKVFSACNDHVEVMES